MTDLVSLAAGATALGTTIAAGIRWVRQQLAIRDAAMLARLETCDAAREALSARVAALEAAQTAGWPSWTRTQSGVVVSVSDELVRLLLAPRGLTAADVAGRKLADLGIFDSDLLSRLADLDRQALARGYAAASGVRLTADLVGTVLKTAVTRQGMVTFIALFVPEHT